MFCYFSFYWAGGLILFFILIIIVILKIRLWYFQEVAIFFIWRQWRSNKIFKKWCTADRNWKKYFKKMSLEWCYNIIFGTEEWWSVENFKHTFTRIWNWKKVSWYNIENQSSFYTRISSSFWQLIASNEFPESQLVPTYAGRLRTALLFFYFMENKWEHYCKQGTETKRWSKVQIL